MWEASVGVKHLTPECEKYGILLNMQISETIKQIICYYSKELPLKIALPDHLSIVQVAQPEVSGWPKICLNN